MEPTEYYTDVLGQLPRLKTYTHILLCFPLEQPAVSSTIDALQDATLQLTKALPWLAHQVCHIKDAYSGTSGIFTLAKCPAFAPPNTILTVKDCTDLCPAYADIIKSRGAQHLFDGQVLARPTIAFPQTYDESTLDPAPVLAFQANLVKGGLLLNAAAQHNFIDGGGLLRVLEYLARVMRGEKFQPEEIEQANRDRRQIVRLLGPDEPMLDHSHLLRESLTNGVNGTAPVPAKSSVDDKAGWTFFRVPAASVTALKELANQQIQTNSNDKDTFVSTDDALSAFIWQRLTLSRLHNFPPSTKTKFSRALDARRALDLPRSYLGQSGFNASCTLPVTDLQSSTLGEVALHMRRAVQEINTSYAVRSWATLIARERDKSRIMFGGKFNPETDVGISSLIHASVEGVDFGSLGRVDLVRRPHFAPLEGCVYLWTRSKKGDVDVLTCLRESDRVALCEDEQWREHVESIG